MKTKLLNVCRWVEDSDGYWKSGCNESFNFESAGVRENGFSFCPFCGKSIKVVPPVPKEGDK